MERIRENIPITIAIAASLALHLFVLFPALGIFDGIVGGGADEIPTAERSALDGKLRGELEKYPLSANEREQRAAETARRVLQERARREQRLPADPREEEVRLGIDESDASTMNWIGYDEYRQHLAELAEFEQAAFRLEVASGSQGDAPSNLPPSEPTPTVAQSPNPSPLPLPASAAGSDASEATNLVALPTPEPATARPASAPTEPAETLGSELAHAQPAQPPEMPAQPSPTDSSAASQGEAKPTESTEGPVRPVESPDAPRTEPVDPTEPIQPSPAIEPSPVVPQNPADGTQPVPPAQDPSRTDPTVAPRTDPDDSPVGPVEKPTSPAPTGSQPNTPPRDPADPEATSVRPPNEAANTAPTPRTSDPSDASSNSVNPEASPTPSPADGTQGGGVEGPQPVDGATSTPTTPAPTGAPGDTVSRPGDLSDRESDPTSVLDVPAIHWQNGRPLAAKGIVLRPVRPRFTTLNYVDGVARNPIGELVLGRDGVPQTARIVRSSGNPGADEAIRAALFKWRASGAQLDRLKPGATVTIRLRIVMLVD
jgi:hypothetical protein